MAQVGCLTQQASTSYQLASAVPASSRILPCSLSQQAQLRALPLANHQASLDSRSASSNRRAVIVNAASSAEREGPPVGFGEIVDVEEVEGIRIQLAEDNTPRIQYLIKWKDGADPSWEPIENLADNLLRDFEEKWWKACREGEEDAIKAMLQNSREVLSLCVDTNNRSALHFCAALGKPDCCRLLCEAGAEVDYPDKDGFTPLHMAVGYSHVSTVKVLLEAGGNPEIPDNQGRNVIQLVDSIREQMPINPQLAGKRVALEEVSALLTGNLFEEVFPKRILESRSTPAGTKEYLVQWLDGLEDSWVKESDVSDDVIHDYERGYEYAEAGNLLKMKMRGDQRLYLVSWLDGRPNSWEYEDHVSGALRAAFESAREGGQSQAAFLPEPATTEQPLSKRATRRARKAARRNAASDAHTNGHSNSAAEPPSDLSSHAHGQASDAGEGSLNGSESSRDTESLAADAEFNGDGRQREQQKGEKAAASVG